MPNNELLVHAIGAAKTEGILNGPKAPFVTSPYTTAVSSKTKPKSPS